MERVMKLNQEKRREEIRKIKIKICLTEIELNELNQETKKRRKWSVHSKLRQALYQGRFENDILKSFDLLVGCLRTLVLSTIEQLADECLECLFDLSLSVPASICKVFKVFFAFDLFFLRFVQLSFTVSLA